MKDWHRGFQKFVLAVCTIAVLCACSADRNLSGTTNTAPTPAAPAEAIDAPSAIELAEHNAAQPVSQPGAEIYPGSGKFLGTPRPTSIVQTSVTQQGDITLNFVNADIKDVAKAVLGDYLGLNYEIASSVQGTVTIQTSQPLKRPQVMPVLEQTLRLSGMTLVRSNDVYKVLPLTDAHHVSGAVTAAAGRTEAAPGYGIQIVPIKYIGAEAMEKLLDPLAPTQGIVHADPARNLLIIEGTQEERETLLADIALFDADWLAGMSFAIYTPNYMDADELNKELTQILGGLNSPIAGIVKLIPINRLNAVLAISPQERYLEQLRAWVARLDRPGQGSDKRIFVYHVQNGRASDLAATLLKVLGGSSTPQQSHSPVPGTGTAATSQAMANDAAPAPTALDETALAPSMANTGTRGFNITADETNNALVIMAAPQEYAALEAALRELDTAPKEVFLEAAIAEVTLTNDLKYGVQYFFQPNTRHEVVLSDTKSAVISAAFPGFSYIFSGGSDIKVILDALSGITHVEVVSSPQLLVLNNQTATLQVGDQVPIVTQQAVSTVTTSAPIVNSVQYQDTGVILKVTPRVNRGGVVMMDISQEVSNVTSTTTSDINSPTIQQRKINSTVAVQDGETVALGGLIANSTTKSKSGIPFLQEVPVLGNLFGDNQNNTTRTELIVLITPHVIDDVKKARAITEELRRKLPSVQPLFDEMH